MAKHRIDPNINHHRNRILRLFGNLHYFRVNFHNQQQWWVND